MIPDDYTVAMQSMNFNKTFIGTYGISEKPVILLMEQQREISREIS